MPTGAVCDEAKQDQRLACRTCRWWEKVGYACEASGRHKGQDLQGPRSVPLDDDRNSLEAFWAGSGVKRPQHLGRDADPEIGREAQVGAVATWARAQVCTDGHGRRSCSRGIFAALRVGGPGLSTRFHMATAQIPLSRCICQRAQGAVQNVSAEPLGTVRRTYLWRIARLTVPDPGSNGV